VPERFDGSLADFRVRIGQYVVRETIAALHNRVPPVVIAASQGSQTDGLRLCCIGERFKNRGPAPVGQVFANDNVVRNAVLEVGALSQEVTVSAAAVTVDASPSVESTITEDQVQNLPLNGRDYNQLVLLGAGAVDPTLSGAASDPIPAGYFRWTRFGLRGVDYTSDRPNGR
jgi:hypothetical protein